ncbi:riboflavin kinase [Peribacillus castrilensis]|uniref:riboflavin kinase n=1 Tax=Peribacillus simplex TaxID=1478 RepID=A0AAN2PJE6_9BACI|nr:MULTISPECIES: riboflavin kinase [Bacillaceae]MCF7621968.1 riboflavin kinase [Peribacillus frigoritolerans]MCP1156147.1 riboflavin kinase [Peribacillus frigoritolerans]MCT1390735.1 riboflavin kinase [Peribacillus frigoritolerans]PRA86335.1 hypothetical protein CQ056_15165 [Peribacillus simplex]CEG33269.1 riboflavin biosynthesis protein [Peribacillus simplex]
MHSESIPKQIIQLKGKVIHGEGRGGKIGFPTANIDFTATWLETGVYGVRIRFNGQKYFGVMNIGVRPTFHKNSPKNIEVHILNFNEVIYGISIQVEVLFKNRE